MEEPLDSQWFRTKKKGSSHFSRETVHPQRLNRHDRLWNFLKIRKEIDESYGMDPTVGARLFGRAKKRFLAEGWTINHFQSSESQELLVQLNAYFRGRDGAPPVESCARRAMASPGPKSLQRTSRKNFQKISSRKTGAEQREKSRNLKAIFLLTVALALGVLLLLIKAGPVPDSELPSNPAFSSGMNH